MNCYALTFRSGLAISGNILQKGLITSKNLTETKVNKQIHYIPYYNYLFFSNNLNMHLVRKTALSVLR